MADEMTLNEAITVLLDCTRKHLQGAGQGYRTGESVEGKVKIKAAVCRAWRRVYGREITYNELSRFNLSYIPTPPGDGND